MAALVINQVYRRIDNQRLVRIVRPMGKNVYVTEDVLDEHATLLAAHQLEPRAPAPTRPPGQRARIKKGIRPYGGRVFPVVEIAPDGRVTLDVGVAGQVLNYKILDPRVYQAHEVDLLPEPVKKGGQS